MKKKVEQKVIVEVPYCNICGKEIGHLSALHDKRYQLRLEMVRGLGKTKDFDAHPTCINKVIREAFKKYL